MGAKFKQGKVFFDYIEKHPTLPISSMALGVSLANLSTNSERRKDAEKQNKEQIKAMNKLSDSMSKVSASFDDAEKRGAVIVKEKEKESDSKAKKKKFRIGYYSSLIDDIWGGTAKGLGVGGLVNGVALSAAAITKKGWSVNQAFKAVGYSVLIGASLGLVLGVTKKIAEKASRNKTNQRVINIVTKLLKNRGFEEEKDFTLDPKTADLEKTKVTILVNKGNGDLKLALNVISDEKLAKVCERIVRDLPDKSKSTQKESNRFNEIIITTLSGGKGNDAVLISDITEKFIRAGYSVYLIEVG
jgi:hypothetical protein